MRRKHNLDERLAQVDELIMERTVKDLNMKTSVENKDYVDFQKTFGNANRVELEIGCGKGLFITRLAAANPDVNYIAIEMLSNVIVEACERVKKEGLKNVRFMILRAECLQSYISSHTISRIYINFPTPLPQKGYEKQRLTNKKFLRIYKDLLTNDGEICLKTDNEMMFEYSICELSQNGFALKDVCFDLRNSDCDENIMTEHEIKYTDMDLPIHRLQAYVSGKEQNEKN